MIKRYTSSRLLYLLTLFTHSALPSTPSCRNNGSEEATHFRSVPTVGRREALRQVLSVGR